MKNELRNSQKLDCKRVKRPHFSTAFSKITKPIFCIVKPIWPLLSTAVEQCGAHRQQNKPACAFTYRQAYGVRSVITLIGRWSCIPLVTTTEGAASPRQSVAVLCALVASFHNKNQAIGQSTIDSAAIALKKLALLWHRPILVCRCLQV